MEPLLIALAVVVMLVGLVGVVVPVLPGLVLVWLGSAGSILLASPGIGGWTVIVVLTLLFAAGMAATVWLPTRQGRRGGIGRTTIAYAAAGGLIGFFVIPVLGLVIGVLIGILVGEHRRHGNWPAARQATLGVLRAYGVGVLVEMVAGVTMIAVWGVALLLVL